MIKTMHSTYGPQACTLASYLTIVSAARTTKAAHHDCRGVATKHISDYHNPYKALSRDASSNKCCW
jgi:hypothetical protein